MRSSQRCMFSTSSMLKVSIQTCCNLSMQLDQPATGKTDGIFNADFWFILFFTGKASHLFWALPLMDREFPCGKRLKSWEWKTIFRRGMSF